MTPLRLLGSDKDKQNVCYLRAMRKVRDPVEIHSEAESGTLGVGVRG